VNGAQPSGIFQAADGKVCGVAFRNGAPSNGQPSNGTVWFIDAGLPAPSPTVVNFLPGSGKAGSTVLLQGAHFVGTTEVEFAGVTASFKVLTANYVRATVPAGAITGSIAVTNAGGTVSSQKTFVVQ
jgi:IPT/TIG domain-containing protein